MMTVAESVLPTKLHLNSQVFELSQLLNDNRLPTKRCKKYAGYILFPKCFFVPHPPVTNYVLLDSKLRCKK